ncbi:hypothetical protein V9T40_004677 [Parthenolecanium corni]|uniref:MSP domain-containing protein n=1 Tax=Parthenolecanium corni TaxID=536013 RepID=A0AAN9Y238_9HEMI
MSKVEQVLIIEPTSELKFKGPFTAPVTSYIKLTNPSENKVCFKIKTTAPKKYCVRPNSGILEKDASVEIAVSLQPFDFDPNEKSKHKFMVQSLVAPLADELNLDSLWKEAPIDALMDSKLKCVFEMPNDVVPAANSFVLPDKEDLKKRDLYAPSENDDTEIKKASAEIARLREELSSTQRENLQLKEDLLVSRQSQQPVKSAFAHSRTNQQVLAESNQITHFVYLGIGIVVGLISSLVGKYIF